MEARINLELDQLATRSTELQVENEMLNQRIAPLQELEKQVLAHEEINVNGVLMFEGDMNIVRQQVVDE